MGFRICYSVEGTDGVTKPITAVLLGCVASRSAIGRRLPASNSTQGVASAVVFQMQLPTTTGPI